MPYSKNSRQSNGPIRKIRKKKGTRKIAESITKDWRWDLQSILLSVPDGDFVDFIEAERA